MLGISLSFLFIKGFFLTIRKGIRLVEAYVIFYGAVLLLHSFHNERFLIPIYPFLLVYLLVNFDTVRTSFTKMLTFAVLGVSFIAGNIYLVNGIIEHKQSSVPAYIESLFWLRNNVSGRTLVMAEDPASVYLYAQKKAIYWGLRPYDAAGSLRELKKDKVTHLLIQHGEGLAVKGKKYDNFDKCVKPITEQYPNNCYLMYQSQDKPEILIYRIKIEGTVLKAKQNRP